MHRVKILLHHRFGQCSLHRRLQPMFASFSSSSSSPTSKEKTWERSAKLVKNTDATNNQYLDKIRSETVDPALQIKTIEDELCGAIGKALGKQGDKILNAVREMKEHKLRYDQLLLEASFDEAIDFASRYNEARERAIKARWELLVHRQAVGFTVGNHSYVHNAFRIPDALPVNLDELKPNNDMQRKIPSEEVVPKKEKFGDQLDWWQKIGRWK
mmetsp:Transcript_10087/g.15320  ORF Transcript_10087/g.15320 Transcript_10087/m.15320 type:complete len:214 (+) Transcript_10087:86-727(+)